MSIAVAYGRIHTPHSGAASYGEVSHDRSSATMRSVGRIVWCVKRTKTKKLIGSHTNLSLLVGQGINCVPLDVSMMTDECRYEQMVWTSGPINWGK